MIMEIKIHFKFRVIVNIIIEVKNVPDVNNYKTKIKWYNLNIYSSNNKVLHKVNFTCWYQL